MEGVLQTAEFAPTNLSTRDIAYQYRYCPNCRHEWPARHISCPACVRWLGELPLERVEQQIVPRETHYQHPVANDFRVVGATVIVLRVLEHGLAHCAINAISTTLIDLLIADSSLSVCSIPAYGWLLWTREGLRRTFLQSLEIGQRLVQGLERLSSALPALRVFRWGIWTDQYILRFGMDEAPTIGEKTASALFHFEPDNTLLSSETIYEANRLWEHFVCVPRRLLTQEEDLGYRFLTHKRPSALDHADVAPIASFVSRRKELDFLDTCERQSQSRAFRLAIVAKAGSGKTRLISEWHQRHPELNILRAGFSLFGGDITSIAAQLTELPDRIDAESILNAISVRLQNNKSHVIVLDDLHWANAESAAFLEQLVDVLDSQRILVVFISRPSGQTLVQRLRPTSQLDLIQLPVSAAREIAIRLTTSDAVAEMAVQRSEGNPLFVEQFAAWAKETNWDGTGEAPANLSQVISARIDHLSETQLENIQQQLRWGFSSDREEALLDLDRLESEVGLWLDRLETGDYGDQVEVSRHLAILNYVEEQIVLIRTAAGRPRVHSSRLRESIERLTLGCSTDLLANLISRVRNGSGSADPNILRDTIRVGDILRRQFHWSAAVKFYELASRLATFQEANGFAHHLRDCRRRLLGVAIDGPRLDENQEIETAPAVDNLRLPAVWAQLGCRFGSREYLRLAAQAAEKVNDEAMVAWVNQLADKPEFEPSCVRGPIDENAQ